MRLPERSERHRQMIEILRANDITAWHTQFVERLLAAHGNSTASALGHAQGDDEEEHAECSRELPAVQ